MEFVPLVATLALALKLLDTTKFALAQDWNAVATQVSAWVSGIVAIFLLASTDFASGINVGDAVLSEVNISSLVLIGLSVASSGSVLYDFKKALDHTDSARTPSLIGGHHEDFPPPTTTI
jgi:hypothetical protein